MAHALLKRIEIPLTVQTLIEEAYRNGNRVPQLHEALLILKTIVETSFESVAVLVDGLDEMKEDERQLIYSSLGDIVSINKTIKLFLSSRNDESQTVVSDQTINYRINLLPEKVSIDINGYIRHSIQTLQNGRRLILRSPALEQENLDSLIEGAKGMFLWVKFQLEDLCIAETDAEIRIMLQNLPKDLSETYDRLLGRVMGRQRQQLIRRMFEWILCSKRPLLVEEMQEAIAFTVDDVCWDESKIPNDMARLVRACGNLVVIDEETTTLQFAHYTVEQYLLSRPAPIGSHTPFSLQLAEIAAAEMCLAYLSFTDFDTQISTYIDDTTANMSAIESLVIKNSLLPNQQLANTAQRIWSSVRPTHAKSSSSSIDYRQYIPKKLPPDQIMREKYRMLAYVTEFWLPHTCALKSDVDAKSRSLVLFNGLLDRKRLMFEIFPWSSLGLNFDDDLLAIAKLGWAIENEHQLLLRALREVRQFTRVNDMFKPISHNHPLPHYITRSFLAELEKFGGACPNSIDNAIWWLYAKLIGAARQGRIRVFSQLPYSCMSETTACHSVIEAAKYGHLKLIQCLLTRARSRAHMDYLHGQGSWLKLSPIEIAAFQGHLEVVRFFVKYTALDVHFDHASEGVAALIRAVNQGNTSVVDALQTALFSKTLLFKNEIFLPHNELQVALSEALRSACIDGNYAVARQLLRQINYILLYNLVSAVIEAISNGHCEIMRLFFREKSQRSTSETETLLKATFTRIVELGNLRLVELFLCLLKEKYTSSVEQARLIQSPLFAAARGNNIKVVETLLASCGGSMSGRVEGPIQYAGTLYCDAPAIRQAASLRDSMTLKTLIKGAVGTSNFPYLDTCATACLLLPNIHQPQLPGINSLLKLAFGGNNRVIARNMAEIVLDLKPGAFWGSREIEGDDIELPLLHLAGLCASENRIAETLLSAGEPREWPDKYNYMILYAAVTCGTLQTVEMVLGHYDFESSPFPQSLKDAVLSYADGDILRALTDRQRVLVLPAKKQQSFPLSKPKPAKTLITRVR